MISFDIYKNKFSSVHFIGIGGISMSGLAEILINEGYNVSGSDMKDSPLLDRLREKGAKIYIDHKKENIKNPDLVVYTDAISNDNPEYLEALDKGLTTVDRGSFLGQLMRKYENSIAVSGTHGKTTTTGMLSVILNESFLDPTILLGGQLDQIGGNVRIGKTKLLLTEACEYKGNILKFYPTIGIILNVEADHLDYYKDLDEIIDTFSKFVRQIPEEGYIVVNNDDKNTVKCLKNPSCNVVTFGINNDSDYKASDIRFDESGYSHFKLTINNNESYDVSLNVMGIHNIYNSLAAIAASHVSGVSINEVLSSIKNYTGTHRRLEDKGSFNNIRVIDDYAHHPTEIKATLSAVKELGLNNTWCIFQPHTYTRTKTLLKEFGESFFDANKVLISDIYAAREKDTGMIHSKDLVDLLKTNGIDALYFDSFDKIKSYIKENAKNGDLVLTMGAGDIHKVGEMLVNK
ncbi:UDP-N-acetylmuramate--L-alanine ligase MurC [Gottschalkia purinilytica]|uniref:UDP-N-acetylmuramate--L-alanine ligase n=1 Tax=Gottschalkia purinilytica TaxID=1503 RepID=A0A0L0W8C5_GOTPU|nr:UDP-N-acetylmuramate--L-alanine ligase [Gottschalkia purinilytica]KNF07799.1 UDP-N-acetylmuramate--L-alanine ligase MurC [Gottschalkia purinilytica]